VAAPPSRWGPIDKPCAALLSLSTSQPVGQGDFMGQLPTTWAQPTLADLKLEFGKTEARDGDGCLRLALLNLPPASSTEQCDLLSAISLPLRRD
jgi:hypothetical protein